MLVFNRGFGIFIENFYLSKDYSMKNYLLSLAVLATVSMLAGCWLVSQPVPQEEVLTHTGQQEESWSFTGSQLAPWEEELPLSWSHQATESWEQKEAGTLKEDLADAWIPKGYTGAIALITETNSGDVITQTGDQLLYRNEVYGFQILLGKDRKGVKISKEEYYDGSTFINFYRSFKGEYEGKYEEFDMEFRLVIFSPEVFYSGNPCPCSDKNPIRSWRQNNKYFFRTLWAGFDLFYVDFFFPSIKCEKRKRQSLEYIACDNRISQAFWWFKAFDI